LIAPLPHEPDAAPRIHAEVDGRQLPIRRAAALQLVLGGLEARREGEALAFRLVFAKGENRLSVPVRGRVAAPADPVGDGEATVALTASAEVLERMRAATDWLASAEPFPRAAIESSGGRDAAPVGSGRGPAWAARLAALMLACAALGAYVVRATAFSLGAPADNAFVAADARTVFAAAAGSVVFLDGDDAVAAGEPLVALKLRNGATRSFDAPFGGRVVARHLAVGDEARQGDPVLTLATADAKPYVRAFLAPGAAFRMGEAPRALVALPGGRNVAVPVGAGNIDSRLEAEDGTVLVGLRLDVDGLDPALVGRPVDVRFEPGSLLDALDLRR
jgi:hypothetical protein